MKTCAKCRWIEKPDTVLGGHIRLVRCECPGTRRPVLFVSPVSGSSYYAKDGVYALDTRPRCIDTNPDGECQWWEQAPEEPQPAPRPWWRRLFG